MGYHLTAEGICPSGKVCAIVDVPPPQNVSQLCFFLGLVIYYGKFQTQVANSLAPLYKKLQKAILWKWDFDEQNAVDVAKEELTAPCLLGHIDQDRELKLACDAFPYGMGPVLSHWMDDGTDKPIMFTSYSLASAQRNYAQLNKEAQAIVFGVNFLFGCKVHHSLPDSPSQGFS